MAGVFSIQHYVIKFSCIAKHAGII
jgi:hypothetical protein